jgi:AraC-like DNA-binding protein
MKDFSEIVFTEELERILDHFASCFEIRIGYFSPEGEEKKLGLKFPNCDFCNFLRSKLGRIPLCAETDRKMFREAATARKLISYKCHAGLNEAIYPVYIENELAGFLMIGQFRTGNECPGSLIAECRRKGFDPGEMQELYKRTPFVSATKLTHLNSLFSLIVNSIINQRIIEIKSNLTLLKVRRFISDNIKRPFSLDDAARNAGRSKSTISHLFKKRYGISFKKYAINAKLEEVDRILQQVNGISVSEAAMAAGYSNQSHFSRLYKKHRGISPSELKKRMATNVI